MRPSFFAAENVGGLSSSRGGRDFDMILRALRGAGYSALPHMYKFEEHGIPQMRHRIFIVGFRSDWRPASFTRSRPASS